MAGAVYWIGADGNAYLKSANGVQKYTGVNNVSDAGFGGLLNGVQGQSVQATRIADPNPPAPVTSDNGGGGGSTGPTAAQIAAFDNQKNTIYSSSNDAATNSASARHSSILDWLDSMKQQQGAIDERGVQNELSKKQGMNSIVDMLGRGLRSGGTMLANKNALSSSAAEAIARAYGDIGRREGNQVSNKYELNNRQIGLDQQSLEQSKATGLRKFDENKVSSIKSIIVEARNQLAQLDADMANANLPQRIAIEQERANIEGAVSNILSQYDAELQQGAGSIKPTSTDQRRATAQDLAYKGVAATNPFDVTTEVPAQFANTGPFASDIPLFSYRGKKAA